MGCRSPAPTTPSSPPTRRCAPATATLGLGVEVALGAFYGGCDAVLSPSRASDDARCARSASTTSAIGRWDRGVDLARFSPTLRDPALPTDAFACSTPAG